MRRETGVRGAATLATSSLSTDGAVDRPEGSPPPAKDIDERTPLSAGKPKAADATPPVGVTGHGRWIEGVVLPEPVAAATAAAAAAAAPEPAGPTLSVTESRIMGRSAVTLCIIADADAGRSTVERRTPAPSRAGQSACAVISASSSGAEALVAKPVLLARVGRACPALLAWQPCPSFAATEWRRPTVLMLPTKNDMCAESMEKSAPRRFSRGSNAWVICARLRSLRHSRGPAEAAAAPPDVAVACGPDCITDFDPPYRKRSCRSSCESMDSRLPVVATWRSRTDDMGAEGMIDGKIGTPSSRSSCAVARSSAEGLER